MTYKVNCIPKPESLAVDILDGEVTVLWKHPLDAPSDCQYNVQFANYTGDWAVVDSCSGISMTSCDLSSLIQDYGTGYKVKVQLVAGDSKSAWAKKKVLPNNTELRPPSFSLWATCSTLTVYVHKKSVLKKLFPYGAVYTIYLQEKGHDSKTITEDLEDSAEEDHRTFTFSSLRWGREYCVNVKVAGVGTLSASNASAKQCLMLPEQEWFIIIVTSLCSVCVVAFVAITAILCYLRRPEKTPAALKSLTDGWSPLSIGDMPPEVVTDKGWFLSCHSTGKRDCAKGAVIHAIADGDGEVKGTSLDSGVGVECTSRKGSRGSPPWRQEDSGCGSLGGSEGSVTSQTDFPPQEASSDRRVANERKDSGVDLCARIHSSPMNLNGRNSGSPKEAVALGNYRRQSPPAVHIQVCDDEETFKQRLPESISAKVVTGYRAGPRWCICSGAGQCNWCQQSLYGSGVIRQYRAMHVERDLQRSKCGNDFDKKLALSTQIMETPFVHMGKDFPHLPPLAQLTLVESKEDFNMDNVRLSLCDVQLTNDLQAVE
ncbi:uncharacterized protein [Brachionichthys hirsutus]|uniref:uncharacterized protein n=1 Tax=Brachionichthys hirsutus TaxID=412623 RepID=UPI00360434EC